MKKDYLFQVVYKKDGILAIMICLVPECQSIQQAINNVRDYVNEKELQCPCISAITDITGTDIVETGGKI